MSLLYCRGCTYFQVGLYIAIIYIPFILPLYFSAGLSLLPTRGPSRYSISDEKLYQGEVEFSFVGEPYKVCAVCMGVSGLELHNMIP